ncbi:hypothetical protein JCM21900_003712 [Sporobolomyces salmonicolor]
MLPLLRTTARCLPRPLHPSSCSSRILCFRPTSTSTSNDPGSRPPTGPASTGGGVQPAPSAAPKAAGPAPVVPSGARDAGNDAAAVVGLVWGVSFVIWLVLYWKLMFDVGYQLEELERLKPIQVALHEVQRAQDLGKGPTQGQVTQLENTVRQLESDLQQTLAEVGSIKEFFKDTSGFQPPESVKKAG